MADVTDAKNIANFQTMISKVTGWGGKYKPSNPDIELSKLQNRLVASNDVTDANDATEASLDAKETDRENFYKPFDPLASDSVSYYESTGTAPNKITDAKEFNRKIHGRRAKKITPAAPGEPTKKTRSVSQRSYIERVEHLDGLIGVYSTDSLYAPNEDRLKVDSMKTYSNDCKDHNAAVTDAITANDITDDARRDTLYDSPTSLFILAGLVKKYARSFGVKSAEYKQISGLEFRKPKKK
jgi:hypothetical protein